MAVRALTIVDMDSAGGAPLPLAGFRVLGFTRSPARPYAAMALACLGADVIKVEPPVNNKHTEAIP